MVESVTQIKSGIMLNVDASSKKHRICEKVSVLNPATFRCKSGKYFLFL